MSAAIPADDNIIDLTTKPTASVIVIDPATARRWLGHNTANRRTRDPNVKKWARDMAAGRWHLTGSPIQFAHDGRLLDGQHRLQAIIEADVSIPMFVVRGLHPDAQMYVDTGAKRTLSDQLALSGHDHHAILAAGAKVAYAWFTDQLNLPRGSFSDSEVREFIDVNPSLQAAASVVWKIRRGSMDVHPSVLCASVWILTEEGHDWDSVIEFFNSIAENRTEGPGDPRNALSQRLAAARRNREVLSAAIQLSMVVRAFNSSYARKPLHRIPALSRHGVVEVPPVVRPKRTSAS